MTLSADNSPIDDSDPVVRLWRHLWVDGDEAAVAELLTDPYTRHLADGTQQATPAEYARHVCTVTRHLRGTEVVFDHLHHADDMTYARFTLVGVNVTTGAPVSIAWLAQYRLEDGRLAESWALRQTDHAWGR